MAETFTRSAAYSTTTNGPGGTDVPQDSVGSGRSAAVVCDRLYTRAGNRVIELRIPACIRDAPTCEPTGSTAEVPGAKCSVFANSGTFPGGYVGESTRGEIAYAHATGKPVSFTDPV
jgi:hypothetical protein